MNRLGWVDAPARSLAQWPALTALAAAARADGLSHTLVCGMGGSSLAPRVLATAFARPSLSVLDSTDPATVLAAARRHDPAGTLYVIASKSGTTVETTAAYRYFATRAGPDHFIAVTDPGTPLERLGRDAGFRAVLEHPADVGGRYAALTVVGMLPAALMGVDGEALLEGARALDVAAARAFGVRLAEAALAGRDKLALRPSPSPPPPGAVIAEWIEQLVAESTGKDGRGLLPVVGGPDATGADVQTVTEFPARPEGLGAEFLRWEYATWALCERLGVNAFDQPDVEAAKAFARAELERDPATGVEPLATLTPAQLRRAARPRDYLAILAYLPPAPEVEARLEAVRAEWGRELGIVTTLGFGPRYLHSTGQLHKGGPNTGLFLVVTAEDAADLEVPGMGRTFGQLKRAQASGDIKALLAKGRRVAHVHLARPDDLGALAPA